MNLSKSTISADALKTDITDSTTSALTADAVSEENENPSLSMRVCIVDKRVVVDSVVGKTDSQLKLLNRSTGSSDYDRTKPPKIPV